MKTNVRYHWYLMLDFKKKKHDLRSHSIIFRLGCQVGKVVQREIPVFLIMFFIYVGEIGTERISHFGRLGEFLIVLMCL